MPSFEKSCGGVIFRKNNNGIEYLLIYNKKGNVDGHWGFPKGHVENNETEKETAFREISEETGLTAEFIGDFRAHTRYSPKEDVIKDVIYFIAENNGEKVTVQQSEVSDYAWLDYDNAFEKISNASDKKILESAAKYIKENNL